MIYLIIKHEVFYIPNKAFLDYLNNRHFNFMVFFPIS